MNREQTYSLNKMTRKSEDTATGPLRPLKSWYAVSTLSRHEKSAASTLESLGFTQYLPLINEERQWSDRKKTISLPLFSGYLFVQMANTPEIQLSVRKVPGVVRFVSNQHGPLAIPHEEIENVRALLSRGTECSPCLYLTAGDRVRVVGGPLAGIEGIFLRSGTRARIVVSIQIIQRSVSVQVAACDVVPAYQTVEQSKFAGFGHPTLRREFPIADRGQHG
jgi:transcription antitermination factor NusG